MANNGENDLFFTLKTGIPLKVEKKEKVRRVLALRCFPDRSFRYFCLAGVRPGQSPAQKFGVLSGKG